MKLNSAAVQVFRFLSVVELAVDESGVAFHIVGGEVKKSTVLVICNAGFFKRAFGMLTKCCMHYVTAYQPQPGPKSDERTC